MALELRLASALLSALGASASALLSALGAAVASSLEEATLALLSVALDQAVLSPLMPGAAASEREMAWSPVLASLKPEASVALGL